MKHRVPLFLFALPPLASLAQEFRGTIGGTVVDPQGSAIPNVKVLATELATKTESRTISDTSGKFTIPFLAPGLYQIDAEAPGFKRQNFTRIEAFNAPNRPAFDTPNLTPTSTSFGLTAQTINRRQIQLGARLVW